LPDVCADLADGSQEEQGCHPLVRGEARFEGEVVEVGYEAFEQELEAWVRGSRVDCVDVLGYVVYREVLEARRGVRGLCWCGHWWNCNDFYGEELFNFVFFFVLVLTVERGLGSRLCRREFG
jgi:hypothetical protein